VTEPLLSVIIPLKSGGIEVRGRWAPDGLPTDDPALVGPGNEGDSMLILGLILLLLGFLLKISILWTVGIILLLVGAVLFILGSTGRAVGGRRHWY
jgi:hypothetical protein